MQKRKLISFILFFSVVSQFFWASAAYSEIEERRRLLLSVIDQELKELTRLNRQTGSRNPTVLLRMAELYLEKARHIKEVETRKFLNYPARQRSGINRESFYRKSNEAFKNSQKVCYYILRRFRRYKERGTVYYILGYNAREFQDERKAEKFFAQAVRNPSSDKSIILKSRLALAEIYYNTKRYRKAIPLYQRALRDDSPRWWTKDSFNLAWCYFRSGRKDEAIELMRNIYTKSKSGRYVDMSSLVERDIGYMYVDANRAGEAVRFYKQVGGDISGNLLRLADTFSNNGKSTLAQKVLLESDRYSSDPKTRLAAKIALLKLHDKFGNYDMHFKTSNDLAALVENNPSAEGEREELLYQMARVSGILQKQVVGKTYSKVPTTRKKKAVLAVKYFDLQRKVDPNQTLANEFLSAETFYGSGMYVDAFKRYENSFYVAKKQNNRKIENLSLTGLLACVGKKQFQTRKNQVYKRRAYELYMKERPASKESNAIHQELFNVALRVKDTPLAESVFNSFRKKFPNERKKTELMYAKIFDQYKDKKDYSATTRLYKLSSEGDVNISPQLGKRLEKYFLSSKFTKIEEAGKSGRKKEALEGYVAIYNEKDSTPKAKSVAAYNAALLYNELGQQKNTYEWSKKALNSMNLTELNKFSESFLVIGSSLYGTQNFNEAIDIFGILHRRLCKTDNKYKKVFFKNLVVLQIAENKTTDAFKTANSGASCKIDRSYRQEIDLEMLKSFSREGNWGAVSALGKKLEGNSYFWPSLIRPYFRYSQKLFKDRRVPEASAYQKKCIDLFNKSERSKLKVPLEGRDVIAKIYGKRIESREKKLRQLKLSFPEKTFNSTLQEKFVELDKITSEALSLFQIGSGRGAIKGYRIMVDSYRYLADEIDDFVPPKKSKSYISSFRKSMNDLTIPLRKKAAEFNNEAKKKVYQNSVLSHDFYGLSNPAGLPESILKAMSSSGIISERGGR